jgi:hypothetical protein
MLRCLLVVVAMAAAEVTVATAEEVGRYQILRVPLGVEGEREETAVLLDTRTGRTWYVIVDEKGRPRWRGIELAGGSQAYAEAPDARVAEQGEEPDAQPEATEPPQTEGSSEQQ